MFLLSYISEGIFSLLSFLSLFVFLFFFNISKNLFALVSGKSRVSFCFDVTTISRFSNKHRVVYLHCSFSVLVLDSEGFYRNDG